MFGIVQGKTHPVFDLDAARKEFEPIVSGELSGQLITSPFDIFAVESLRDQFKLRYGECYPTDVFIFGYGTPPVPFGTMVGGKPWWPRERAWPVNQSGEPLQFLAQFNFSDSADLFPELPSDLLLIFVDAKSEWKLDPAALHFEWSSSSAVPAAAFDKSLAAIKSGPFFGTIYRTADYPAAFKKAEKVRVRRNYLLPVLQGTKIGGVPAIDDSETEGRFLCQFGSIRAEADSPFPWVNRAEPLTMDADATGVYGEENSVVIGDMGSILVFMTNDGEVRACSTNL